MKLIFKFTFLVFSLGLVFGACKNAPKGEKAETTDEVNKAVAKDEGTMLKLDPAQSSIHWTGSKVTGKHNGTLAISDGAVQISNGKLSGGRFIINMNSITNLDQEGKDKQKLEGHLKSGDFFDATNFPTSSFVITGVEPITGRQDANTMVTGNLTIKNITKSISFPAHVNVSGTKLSAITPAFTINRTEWDVKYGSGIIGTAKDRIINDNIGLVLSIKANG